MAVVLCNHGQHCHSRSRSSFLSPRWGRRKSRESENKKKQGILVGGEGTEQHHHHQQNLSHLTHSKLQPATKFCTTKWQRGPVLPFPLLSPPSSRQKNKINCEEKTCCCQERDEEEIKIRHVSLYEDSLFQAIREQ